MSDQININLQAGACVTDGGHWQSRATPAPPPITAETLFWEVMHSLWPHGPHAAQLLGAGREWPALAGCINQLFVLRYM